MSEVTARVASVRERIARAAQRAGRHPSEITLVAVSKGVGTNAIAEAVGAGVTDLGENRAQELVSKAAVLSPLRPVWHFVGRLQRNKVKLLAPHVTLWHSVDRVELGEPLARHAPGARVLVEVNVAGEEQKGGCPPGDAPALVEALAAHGLAVEGLMTVPPAGEDPRRHFAALRELAAAIGLRTLSMGMSGDFEAAVEEGSTMVRVGTAIFGVRPGAGGER